MGKHYSHLSSEERAVLQIEVRFRPGADVQYLN